MHQVQICTARCCQCFWAPPPCYPARKVWVWDLMWQHVKTPFCEPDIVLISTTWSGAYVNNLLVLEDFVLLSFIVQVSFHVLWTCLFVIDADRNMCSMVVVWMLQNLVWLLLWDLVMETCGKLWISFRFRLILPLFWDVNSCCFYRNLYAIRLFFSPCVLTPIMHFFWSTIMTIWSTLSSMCISFTAFQAYWPLALLESMVLAFALIFYHNIKSRGSK